MANLFSDHPDLRRFQLPNVELTGKKIGSGAYGSVEEGKISGTICAVKRLHEIFQDRSEIPEEEIQKAADQFVEECRLMTTLQHPHMVLFLGVCFLPGSRLPALVMERLLTSLHDLLENEPNIPLGLKHSFLCDVALGLSYLHGRSPPLIHRDLSARNVLLNSAMMAKIGDLGVARIVPNMRVATMTKAPGASVYMPPEAGEAVRRVKAVKDVSRYDITIDIFSLGVVTIFTLTQCFPQNLLPSVYHDQHGRLAARSELERREDYMQQIYSQFRDTHPLVQMIKQCLDNLPNKRPAIQQVMQLLEQARATINDPECVMGRLELVKTVKELSSTVLSRNRQIGSMRQEIEVYKQQVQTKEREHHEQTKAMEKEHAEMAQRMIDQIQVLEEKNEQMELTIHSLQTELKQLEDKLSSAPDIHTQRKEILSLKNQRLQKGDTWYLISVKWMKQWMKYVEGDQSGAGQQNNFPGPIDNSNLFTDNRSDTLKEHLIEELDYSLIPEPAWNKLVSWYGVSDTSRPIARDVLEYGLCSKQCKVEVYPLRLKLCIHPETNETIVMSFSQSDIVADLESEIRATFNIPKGSTCRLWHSYLPHAFKPLNNPTQSLREAGVCSSQTIVLEEQKEDGTWPRTMSVFPKRTVPPIEAQREEIHTLINQRLQKGDTWYLVDVRWMKQWKKYVGYDQWDRSSAGQQSYFPGPLYNSSLFTECSSDTLKEHLMEELNYSLIPEPAWNKLVSWYGVSDTSRPIARKVVEYGLYMKHSKVEVYLLEFKLCVHPKQDEYVVKSFSRADTVADLERELRATFHVPEGKTCRVRHRYMSHTYELLNNPTQTLQDAGLYNLQTIVLEQQNEDGTWPWSTTETSYASSHSTRSQGSTPGLCGLTNLGNTCFMNATIQCLSNTEPITEYFRKQTFKKHINKDNPLGTGGAAAEVYGALLEDLWSGKNSACSPRQLQTTVQRFAPQFAGKQQCDSQEFLSFLLESLHEDLNLVKRKPYVDMTIRTDGREEKDVAEEFWYKHLQRNQSVVVSVFQGQLKTTVNCSKCKQISKTFDPFMSLSLPLPVKKSRCISVVVVRADPMAQMCKYAVVVPTKGSVADLKRKLSEVTQIPSDMMVMVDVYNSRFHRIYDNRESLTHILDRDDIYVYELSHPISNPNMVHVPVYHREEIVKEVKYTYSSYTQRYHHLFGVPTVVRVPRNTCTYRQLYQAVLDRCRKFVHEKKKVGTDMFQLVVVNSYGTQEVKKLPKDETPFRLSSQTYISCDWPTDMKDTCYDVEAAETVIEDSSCAMISKQPPKNIPLYNCLDLFVEEEQLDSEDAHCSNCNDSTQATRKVDFWKLPRVLVIHLERFTMNQGLDMSDYMKAPDQPEPIYNLFAVCNHFSGMGGGHYTAYCKNQTTGKWFNFDDSHVTELSEEKVMTSAAYILFYCRRDERRPVLNRTLAQCFAEEVKRRRERYHHCETSGEEEEMMREEEMMVEEEEMMGNQDNDDTFKSTLEELG